jgi:Protein of unknown function (DUF2917)
MHSRRSCIAFRDFVCPRPFDAPQFVAHQHEVNVMNPNTLAEDQTSTLLTVDANPMWLRLPVGSAIFAYSGEVWITQEGTHEDVILGPGQRFDVHNRAPILASSTKKRSAAVYVACARDAAEHPDSDLYAVLHARARRLRAEELKEFARKASDRLSHALAALFAQLRTMLAPSKRIPVTNVPR